MDDTNLTPYPCELTGCWYNEDGVCHYNQSKIKIPSQKACYEDDREAYLDYLDSCNSPFTPFSSY
jgi:hypothetical protein